MANPEWTEPSDWEEAERIARNLTPSQRGLLDDLCGHPGLFTGQYVFDGAGIEHLPRELWWQSYAGPVFSMLGLGKAYPSELGVLVNEQVSA